MFVRITSGYLYFPRQWYFVSWIYLIEIVELIMLSKSHLVGFVGVYSNHFLIPRILTLP